MKYLVANWKMYLNHEQSLDLAKKYKKKLKVSGDLQVIIAPSAIYLSEVKDLLGRAKIKLSAQNVAAQKEGAFTGEISAAMLKSAGCDYSLIGHSERRIHAGETSEMINHKINQCYHAGLTPILCVGETFEEKANNQTEHVLVRQLQAALHKVDGLPEKDLIIAYEPVWAVGSGKCLDAREMQPIYRIIKRTLSSMFSEKFYDEKVHLLYGGSVNGINAKGFWQLPYLSGLLVGGKSLEVQEMEGIAELAS